jgi:hypothetical protein
MRSQSVHLRGGGLELGHGLGALGHGVLGKLTGEEQADGRLDLAGREGALLVVAGQAGGLKSEALEDVVDERVQDGHAALGDARVGVHLLKHLVDVGAVLRGGREGVAVRSRFSRLARCPSSSSQASEAVGGRGL